MIVRLERVDSCCSASFVASTVTFVAEKAGFANPKSRQYLGEVTVGDIGCPREVIEAVNRAGKSVMALDLPSGLDADTGRPQGVAMKATITMTFAAQKVGFTQPGAFAHTGQIHVAAIGNPRRLLVEMGVSPNVEAWSPSTF